MVMIETCNPDIQELINVVNSSIWKEKYRTHPKWG